jgi:predicted acyltransferase
VGFSMVYSYRKRLINGSSDKDLWFHTLKRVLILWILGMAVQGNLLTYDPEHIKFYTNTLQAIASGYLISTILILYLPVIYQAIATAGLMLIFWAIAALLPVGGITANAYSPEGNVLMFIERTIMGRFIGWGTYTWIVSSLNFGATVMLGVFCGYIMQNSRDKWSKFRMYIVSGISLIILAKIWDLWHPIIKKIWTGSFVLFSGGICILLLALFFLIIDIWKYQTGLRWMIVIGSNAIFAYIAWHLFSSSFMGMADVFLIGFKPWIGDWFETLRIFGATLILYFLLRYMFQNKTFIKI